MNDFFNPSGYPGYAANGDSISARTEIAAIGTAFDKMPTVTGNGLKVVRVNSAGTALEAVATSVLLPEMQSGSPTYITSVAGTDTITGTVTPVLTAYTTGAYFRFIAAGANTGAATVNISGLGAVAIVRPDGAALLAGDISGANFVCELFKRAGDFVLLNAATYNADKLAAAASAAAAALSETAAGTSASNAAISAGSASASQIATAADALATAADALATAADRSQTGLDAIATAADRVQTGLDAIATAADAVSTASDASTATTQAGNASTSASNALASENAAAASATALTGTSTTSLTPSLAEKVVTTQAGKSFSAGTFIEMVSDSNAAVWMYGPVTSYVGTTLTFTPTVVGTATAKTDWTIYGRVGARGATGTAGTDGIGTTFSTSVQVATAAQTVFSIAYTVGYIDVYQNGAKLIPADFTATNGTSVVLATGATLNDEIMFVVYTTVSVANALVAADIGTSVASLGVNTFTGQQTFAETADTVYAITDGAAFEIDPVNGNIQTITLGAARTPAATNFAAGQAVLLGIDDGTAYAITWTTVAPTWIKAGGTASAPTLATSGYTWILLWKVGSTIYATEVGKP